MRTGKELTQVDEVVVALAHLLAVTVFEKAESQTEGLALFFSADQLDAAQNVRPLIVAAQLQRAIVFLEKMQEIVALHQHIVELQKRQTLFEPLLVALCRKHPVHGEMRSDFTEKIDVI